jgi:hypothetical protein
VTRKLSVSGKFFSCAAQPGAIRSATIHAHAEAAKSRNYASAHTGFYAVNTAFRRLDKHVACNTKSGGLHTSRTGLIKSIVNAICMHTITRTDKKNS